MSARHPRPWEWEEHELSEGMSCIVYDARGHRVGGLDHLDRETAAEICDRPRATSGALNVPVRSREKAALDVATAALRWSLPLAERAMEEHRQERLRCGHAFGTKRVGLYDSESDEMDHHRCSLDRIATILGEGESK